MVVTGFAAERIDERVAGARASATACALETRLQPEGARSGTTPTRCGARASTSRDGVLLVNGDTVHPAEVEETLLAARGDDDLVHRASTTSSRSARRR